jgi:NhaP-type Na+/H+ or K+/H+ antiporter
MLIKYKKHDNNSVFICSNVIPVIVASIILLSAFNQNFLYSALAIGKSTIDDNPTNTKSDTSSISSSIPNAKSVFDTGTMSLPASISGFIIYIPDESHTSTNTNISQCDISAIEDANSSHHSPSLQFLRC